jgi:YfiH family protein
VISWLKPDWPAPPGVQVLSTYRGGGGASQGVYASLNLGDHVGDDSNSVAANRRQLAMTAGLPTEPSWLVQVHGKKVADLDADGPSFPADAAITRRGGKVAAILSADCLPIVFASDSGDAVAAAHAGWRGLAAGIIEATVTALAVPAGRLLVWLGPAIGPEHFEVGAEVRQAFIGSHPQATDAFRMNSRGRFMADLALLARQRLATLGIDRVYGCGECTYTRADRYFSHRRDGATGRQATLIWRNA